MGLAYKQGDTWTLHCARLRPDGSPYSIEGVTILAQVRYGSHFLTFTPTPVIAADGTYTLVAAAEDTILLPHSRHYKFDIQYDGGAIESSETVDFEVLEDNSRNAG